MKSSKLIQVRPSDFNVTLLRQAMHEGRLFIAAPQTSPEEIRENGIRRILRYVSRIDDCASPEYRSRIHLLWDRLLRCPELGELFTRDQLKALLQQRQKTTPARVFLCQWSKRKLIKPVGNDRYQKIVKVDPYNSLTSVGEPSRTTNL